MDIITKEMLAENFIKGVVSRVKSEMAIDDSNLSGEEILNKMNENLEVVGDIFLAELQNYVDDEDIEKM